jgi:hypothetical protein
MGGWSGGLGSTDLTRPIPTYQKQSDFAVGGLLGYDFGPLTLQAYATTEVVEHNYGGRDTRGWLRMIIPLCSGPLRLRHSSPSSPRGGGIRSSRTDTLTSSSSREI